LIIFINVFKDSSWENAQGTHISQKMKAMRSGSEASEIRKVVLKTDADMRYLFTKKPSKTRIITYPKSGETWDEGYWWQTASENYKNKIMKTNVYKKYKKITKALLKQPKFDEWNKKNYSLDSLTFYVMTSVLRVAQNTKRDKQKHTDKAPVLPLERLENRAKNAIRYGIGNCGECQAVALMMFRDLKLKDTLPTWKGSDIPHAITASAGYWEKPLKIVDGVRRGGGDHAFLLICQSEDTALRTNEFLRKLHGDRKKGIEIGAKRRDSLKFWIDISDDVIICDPWYYHDGNAEYIGNLNTPKNEWAVSNKLYKFLLDNGIYVQQTHPHGIGSGRSERHKKVPRYAQTNFYNDPVEKIKKTMKKESKKHVKKTVIHDTDWVAKRITP